MAICAALALGGCGGGGSETDTASVPSSTTQATATAPEPSHQSTAEQDKGEVRQSRSPAKAEGSKKQSAATVKVPPISSAAVEGSKAPAPGVKTVKGGDDSVQTYGTEASQAARTEAAIALQGYLNARSQEDWAMACSGLAQRPKEELEKLTGRAQQQGEDLGGCAGVMAALLKGTPQAQLREEARITEVLSFRGGGEVHGDPSYLIFKGPPGQTLYSMPMYLEAGGWKVGLAQPSELPV